MAKVGRKSEAQKIVEESKLKKRKKLEKARDYLIDHYSLKKVEIESRGSLNERWYEIFEGGKSQSKMSVCLYYPSNDKRAMRFTTFRENGSHNLDLDLWSEEDWPEFIEDSKKYYAFIRRNK